MKKYYSALASICILCAFTACKPDGNLIFETFPEESLVGEFLPPVNIGLTGVRTFQNNNRNSATITCRLLDPNNNGGQVSGTMTHKTENGMASFNDLTIDKVGTGYKIVFSADGYNDLTSPAFNIVPAGGTDLEFSAEPQAVKSHGPFSQPVRVRVLDGMGNQLADANHNIKLEFAENPGELIFHAAGGSSYNPGDRFFEVIDPNFSGAAAQGLPQQLHWLRYPPMDTAIAAMAYDNATKGVYAATEGSSGDFLWIYPPTGRQVLIGYQSLDNVNGLAFDAAKSSFDNDSLCVDEPGADCSAQLKNRLVAVLNSNATLPSDHLYEIDARYGAYKDLGLITRDNNATINGFYGLARDLATGTLYAAVDTGQQGYALGILDTESLSLSIIGDTGLELAGLAAGRDGTLYGVTASDATPPATLYRLNASSGAVDEQSAVALDNATSGQAITMISAYLSGNKADAVNGEAVFPQLKINAAGNGYRLMATGRNLQPKDSTSFDVTAPTIGGSVEFTMSEIGLSEGRQSDNSTVMVKISTAQDHDVTVTIAASQGTASDASDSTNADISLYYFEGISQTRNYITEPYYQVTIPAGQTTASLKFAVYADDRAEPDESFSLIIVDASLAESIGANDTVNVTIRDAEETGM